MLKKINTKTKPMSRKRKPIYPNQIRRYRRKRHLRLRDIAKLTGRSDASHFSHWEKGRKLPTLTNALKLSAAIGCPVEVLFWDHFQPIRKNIYAKRKKFNIYPEYD